MPLTKQEIETSLQKALKVDINALAEKDRVNEHNMREEWSATVAKVQEFTGKYVH